MTDHLGWQKPFYIICSFFEFIKKIDGLSYSIFRILKTCPAKHPMEHSWGCFGRFFPFCALNQGSRRAVYAPRVKTRPCEKGERGSRCLEAGCAVWAPALVPTSVALARRSANLSLLGFLLFALFCSVLFCFGLCFWFLICLVKSSCSIKLS